MKYICINGRIKKIPAEWKKDFELTAQEVEKEGIPSINARIRKLKGE